MQTIPQFRLNFLFFLLESKLLMFKKPGTVGKTLQSGRKDSPYLVTIGNGEGLLDRVLNEAYLSLLIRLGVARVVSKRSPPLALQTYSAKLYEPSFPYDHELVFFGPAYKGITIASNLAYSLGCRRSANRKKEKTHGDASGMFAGYKVQQNDDVIITEDVVTTGDSSIQAIEFLRSVGANLRHLIIAFDRWEHIGFEDVEDPARDPFPVMLSDAGRAMPATDFISQRYDISCHSILNAAEVYYLIKNHIVAPLPYPAADIWDSAQEYFAEHAPWIPERVLEMENA